MEVRPSVVAPLEAHTSAVERVEVREDNTTPSPSKAPPRGISEASDTRSARGDLEDVFPAWCTFCARCRWWTGDLCLQEHLGFRECPEYGVSFMHYAVAQDHMTGRGVLIPLEKGQTTEDLREALTAQGRMPAPYFEGGWDVLNS